jgi:inner membrane protein
MDNVTHTLFALTLARTGLGRGGRGATAALVLASNAPDIDIVAALGGSANYLAWHRGPSHGPLGVAGLAVLTAAMVWAGRRLMEHSWGPPSRLRFASARLAEAHSAEAAGGPVRPDPTSFTTLLAVSIVGVLLLIMMDLPTSYGTRLLSPFSWRWYAIDLMPIIDIYLLVVLTAGLVLGSRSTGMARRSAVIVLALMAANYGIRLAAHQQALAAAARRVGPALPPPCHPSAAFGSLFDSWPQPGAPAGGARCLLDTAAIPSFASPFEWRVIAQLPDGYEELDGNDAVWIPNRWTPMVEQAAATHTAQVLLGFSRFPVAREFREPSGATTVRFTDLRFATGLDNPRDQSRRSALFTATITFGPGNEFLDERLGD